MASIGSVTALFLFEGGESWNKVVFDWNFRVTCVKKVWHNDLFHTHIEISQFCNIIIALRNMMLSNICIYAWLYSTTRWAFNVPYNSNKKLVYRNDIIKFCFGEYGNIYISWNLLISLLKLFLTEFIMMWARIMLFTLIYYIFCQIFTFNLRELIIFFPTLLRLHKTKCQKTMLPFPSGKLLKRSECYISLDVI